MSRAPRQSETEPELETETPVAQSEGLFLTVGYRSPFFPCLVSPHFFQHLLLLEDPICILVSQDDFFRSCHSFCLVSRSFLLSPPPADLCVPYSGQSPFLFPHLLSGTPGLPLLPICVRSPLFTLPLSQICGFLGGCKDRAPHGASGLRGGVGRAGKPLVLERPAAFDLLGVQKWGFWWMDPPEFPEAVCAPCPEDRTSGSYPFSEYPRSLLNLSNLIRCVVSCSQD